MKLMDYWQDGNRIARMVRGDTFTAEVFHWADRQWRPNDRVGAEIRWSGNFDLISEAQALQRISAPLTA